MHVLCVPTAAHIHPTSSLTVSEADLHCLCKQGIIMDYDDRHIGPSKPSPQSKQRRRSHSAQLSADASASLGNNHLSRNPAPGLVGSVRGHIELDAHGNPVNGLMHRGEHVARLPSHLSGESPEPGE